MKNNGIKGILIITLLGIMMFSLVACGKKDNGSRTDSKSDVEQLLDDAKSEDVTTETTVTSEAILGDFQITGNDATEGTVPTNDITTEFPLAAGPSQMDGSGAVNPNHQGGEISTEAPLAEADPNVDVDLTVLTANMVYAEVYNMMMYPDSYLGKTIKVSGPYYPLYYDGTGNYYHYVMIEDAMACCKNGMEFIWDEGSHIYPDEYPKKDEIVEIVGELKSYKEENYTYYYLDIDGYKVIEQK